MGGPPVTVTASLGSEVDRDDLAGAPSEPLPGVVAMAVMVGAVVSICRMPAGLPIAPAREAGLPAASAMVAPPRLPMPVTVRSAVFWPGWTV